MKKFLLCLIAVAMAGSLLAGCAGKADSKKIESKADLEGKTVALQTDSSAEAALAADEISSKVKEIVKFPDNIAALNDLKAGRVDAVVLDEVVANYYASKDSSSFLVLGDSLAAEEYGIAFKKGNDELFNKVRAALAIMSDNGAAAIISDKWFGKDIFIKNFLTEHTVESFAVENPPSGKKLVVGLDDSFPPMGFRDEKNEIVGFDIDLAKEVGRLMGYEVVLQPIDWASKELELESGNIDCIWNALTITQERKDSMLITEPYLANNQVIVVKP